MANSYSKKFLAASLLKCAEEALLYFRELPEGGCVVIAPDGRKLRYSDVQLEHEQKRLIATLPRSWPKSKVTPAFELKADPVTQGDSIYIDPAVAAMAATNRKEQEIARKEIGRVLALPVTAAGLEESAPVTRGDSASAISPADPPGAVTQGNLPPAPSPKGKGVTPVESATQAPVTRSKRSESAEAAYQKRQQKKQKGK